jgi:hypothetical protein
MLSFADTTVEYLFWLHMKKILYTNKSIFVGLKIYEVERIYCS